MDSVAGTDLGMINRQHQGTGLATILPNAGVEDDFKQWSLLEYQRKAARKKEMEDKRDAFLKKLNAGFDDYWMKHSAEIGDAQSALLDQYAGLSEKGIVDPFASAKPEALEFQKNYMRTMRMVEASKQMKAAAGNMVSEIQKDPKGASAFTPQSILAKEQLLDRPLSEIVEGGFSDTPLLRADPYVDAVNFWKPYVSVYEGTLNGASVTDAGIDDYVRTVLSNPDTQGSIQRTYVSRLAQMDPAEMQALELRANSANRDPLHQLAFEDAKRVSKRREPFNPYAAIQAAGDKVDVDYRNVSGPQGASKRADKKDLDANVDIAVQAMLADRSDWDTWTDGGKLRYDAADTPVERRRKLEKYLHGKVKAAVKLDESSTRTDKGEEKQSGEKFLSYIKSGNLDKQEEAAGFLIGARLFNNFEVSEAHIVSSPEDNGEGTLELTLTTPLGIQLNKEDEDGLKDAAESEGFELVEKQGRRSLLLPLSKVEPNDNKLLRFHDLAMKKTGRRFEAREVAIPKVGDLMKPSGAPPLKTTY